MRILFSFILSLFVYFLIILFLYFAFFKKNEKKEVLIHTAIIYPQIKQLKKTSIKYVKKSITKSVKNKKIIKKIGSKKNITRSGNANFNDIFKNVNYNIPTKKLSLKKEEILSRFKANNIEKELKNIKDINVNISFSTSSNIKKEKINELVKKIGNVWNEISDIPGEYAKIKFINQDGKVFVYLLESNLDISKQKILLEKLKSIQFDKNIDLTIKLQTKVNK